MELFANIALTTGNPRILSAPLSALRRYGNEGDLRSVCRASGGKRGGPPPQRVGNLAEGDSDSDFHPRRNKRRRAIQRTFESAELHYVFASELACLVLHKVPDGLRRQVRVIARVADGGSRKFRQRIALGNLLGHIAHQNGQRWVSTFIDLVPRDVAGHRRPCIADHRTAHCLTLDYLACGF
jgi:hypothetical protein